MLACVDVTTNNCYVGLPSVGVCKYQHARNIRANYAGSVVRSVIEGFTCLNINIRRSHNSSLYHPNQVVFRCDCLLRFLGVLTEVKCLEEFFAIGNWRTWE